MNEKEFFTSLTEKCSLCDGYGIVEDPHRGHALECSSCGGRNKFSKPSPKEVALKLNEELSTDDPRLNNIVYIRHFDGTEMTIHNAFVINQNNLRYIVTKHHGCMTYNSNDLEELTELPLGIKVY